MGIKKQHFLKGSGSSCWSDCGDGGDRIFNSSLEGFLRLMDREFGCKNILKSIKWKSWSTKFWVCLCVLPSDFSSWFDPFPVTLVGFPGGSVVKNPLANAGHVDLISGSGRSPGEENDNPLQYCCLENSMDRGAWATVHGVTKSQTWLIMHAHAPIWRETPFLPPSLFSFLFPSFLPFILLSLTIYQVPTSVHGTKKRRISKRD